MNKTISSPLVLLIALIALLVAAIALYQAKSARDLARSDVAVEENNSMITPLYDQEKNSWSYLAVYEISVSNLCGPVLQWQEVKPSTQAGGFLVGLKNEQFVSPSVSYQAFVCEPTLAQIQANPKLIRELSKKPFLEPVHLNHALAPGESKSIRLGVIVQAFDANGQSLVDMVLLSFDLSFDHDRQYVFRRGFPIQPVKIEQ